jgi:hypothetical protein
VDQKREFVYQKQDEIAYFVPFSTIQSNLSEYLRVALAQTQKWSSDVILREGAQTKHPMVYYRDQGGITLQTVD